MFAQFMAKRSVLLPFAIAFVLALVVMMFFNPTSSARAEELVSEDAVAAEAQPAVEAPAPAEVVADPPADQPSDTSTPDIVSEPAPAPAPAPAPEVAPATQEVAAAVVPEQAPQEVVAPAAAPIVAPAAEETPVTPAVADPTTDYTTVTGYSVNAETPLQAEFTVAYQPTPISFGGESVRIVIAGPESRTLQFPGVPGGTYNSGPVTFVPGDYNYDIQVQANCGVDCIEFKSVGGGTFTVLPAVTHEPAVNITVACIADLTEPNQLPVKFDYAVTNSDSETVEVFFGETLLATTTLSGTGTYEDTFEVTGPATGTITVKWNGQVFTGCETTVPGIKVPEGYIEHRDGVPFFVESECAWYQLPEEREVTFVIVDGKVEKRFGNWHVVEGAEPVFVRDANDEEALKYGCVCEEVPPVEPEEPTEPEQPVEPEQPSHPEVPAQPEPPVTPEVPAKPAVPAAPAVVKVVEVAEADALAATGLDTDTMTRVIFGGLGALAVGTVIMIVTGLRRRKAEQQS